MGHLASGAGVSDGGGEERVQKWHSQKQAVLSQVLRSPVPGKLSGSRVPVPAPEGTRRSQDTATKLKAPSFFVPTTFQGLRCCQGRDSL